MVQAKTGHGDIERTIPKRQSLRVAQDAKKVHETLFHRIRASERENCGSKIQPANPFHMPRKPQRQRSGPATQINGSIVWTSADQARKVLSLRGPMGHRIVAEDIRSARESFTYRSLQFTVV